MNSQDKIAEVYLHEKLIDENINRKFILTRNERTKFLEVLQLTKLKDKVILDAGCGEGLDGLILSKLGNRVVGVELTPKVAKNAQNLAKQANFEVIIADLEQLPIREGVFDVVFCGWVLHHFKDLEKVIKELARVLLPQGEFDLVEPNGSSVAVKLTELIEGIVRLWLVKSNIDTPNETLHSLESYVKALNANYLSTFHVTSCYFGNRPPLPKKQRQVFFMIVLIRNLIYSILMRILKSPLKGTDLLIKARKVCYRK